MKRVLCLILTLVLLLGMIPTAVFAEEPQTDTGDGIALQEETSVETEPAETEPAETEPAETEPAETEPAETEPVETEPLETEPVEVETEETVPEETESAYIEEETVVLTAPAALTEETPAITRVRWISALVETFAMFIEDDNYPDNYYSDLTGEEEYYRDIMLAVEFGVIDLDPGMPFRPEDAVTREFAAQTLNYALGYINSEESYTYSDSDKTQHPDDLQIAVNRGWFQLSDGAVLPDALITAQEMTDMLADAEKVLQGEEISDDYDCVYSFTSEVIQIPDGTVAEYHEDKVVIYDCPVSLKSGDVFVVYFNELPCLYMAGKITESGNKTTISVTELAEGDYYEGIDAQGVVNAKFTEFEVLEGTDVLYIDENTGKEYTDARVAEYALRAGGSVNLGRTLSVKRELAGNGLSGYVTVKLKDPQIVYEIKSNKVSVKLVSKMETVYGVSCDFVELQGFEPIPLMKWVAPGIGGLTVSLVMEAKASIEGTTSGNLTVGVEYRGGTDFRLMKDFKKTAFTMTMELSGKVGVEAKLGVTDIPGDVIEGYVYAEVGGAAKVSIAKHQDGHSCTHAAMYMYAEAGATLSAKLGIYKKTYKNELFIWDDGNSPIRVVHHYEDGVLVPGCTRGDNPNNGYYTPVESPYWGSSWSGGDHSRGYNKKREPVMIFGYSLDEEGTATITSYTGNATALIIPKTIDGHTVTKIGAHVFKQRFELHTVTMPDTITWIGEGAFANCVALETLILSKGLVSMGAHAFYNCDSLRTVEIPASLEKTTDAYIYEYAYGYVYGPFYGCDNLKEVTFEEGTTIVANDILANCPGLRKVVIPDTVTEVKSGAFANCVNLAEVTLSKNTTTIEGHSFKKTKISEISFPDSVTSIGAAAFAECENLTSVALPKGLNTITAHAFYNCDNITSVWVPKALEKTTDSYINEYHYGYVYGPFYGCDGIKEVTFEEGMPIIPNDLFAYCAGIEKIVIPDTVTTVESGAFAYAENLAEVILSKNTTTIEGHSFKKTKISEISFPDSVTSIGAAAFAECENLTSVVLPKGLNTIVAHAFYNCDNITSVWIPKALEKTTDSYIYEYHYGYVYGPFYGCDGIKEVTFEEGMPIIPNDLFAYCAGIEKVTIPDTVTNVKSGAFRFCTNLATVEIPNSVTAIGYGAFEATGLTKLVIPESVTSIDERVAPDSLALKEVTWPSSLSTIPKYAFAGCRALETVNLAEGVMTIGYGAFRDCDMLPAIKLPQTVTKLDVQAFSECDALASITIPEAVTSIGNECFYNCDSLQTITVPDRVSSFGNKVFYDCDLLKDVRLGTAITSIPASTFEHCDVLESLVVPYRVTNIGDNAFKNCVAFTTITVPKAAANIADNAFSYPGIMTMYGIPGSYGETFANAKGIKFVENTTAATSVKLHVNEMELKKNASSNLYLTVEPINFADDVTFKSSNTEVVTVSESGQLKAVGVGTATIKVMVGKVSASCKVTVSQGITRIWLDRSNLSLDVPNTHQLKATIQPTDASNQNLAWTSSDGNVATVDEDGLVTAVGNGKVTITATTQDGTNLSASCTVTVTDPNNIPVTSITLDKTSLTLNASMSQQLQATVKPNNAANQNLIWSSSDETVATVDENGVVKALAKGTAQITAAAADGYGASATCAITVPNTAYYVTDPAQMESAHPYEDNCSDLWVYTAAGAGTLEVTFDDATVMEDGFDYLKIYDAQDNLIGTYTGTELVDKAVEVPGDTVKIQILSDDSGNDWGFKVAGIREKHVHNYTDVVTPPTCTEKGYTTHTCSCGDSYADTYVDATGHDHKTVVTAPTCEEKGYTTYICECGDSYVDTYVDATGHSMGAWTVVTAPTENEKGSERRDCANCDHFETREVEVLASAPGDLNGDDSVNDDDVILLLWHTLLPDLYPISAEADFNADGNINDEDVIYLLWHTLLPDLYPL